jgi:hypothetical protein
MLESVPSHSRILIARNSIRPTKFALNAQLNSTWTHLRNAAKSVLSARLPTKVMELVSAAIQVMSFQEQHAQSEELQTAMSTARPRTTVSARNAIVATSPTLLAAAFKITLSAKPAIPILEAAFLAILATIYSMATAQSAIHPPPAAIPTARQVTKMESAVSATQDTS